MDDSALKREFARRLTERMNTMGWNQSELARAATRHYTAPRGSKNKEITRNNISRYATMESLPGPARLQALALALKCEPVDLLPTRRTAPDPVSLQARDAGNGSAQLTIAREVPWPIALKILELLREADDGLNDETSGRRVSGHRKDSPAMDRRRAS